MKNFGKVACCVGIIVILIVGFLFFNANKNSYIYFEQKKLSEVEQYIFTMNDSGTRVDYLNYEYSLPIKEGYLVYVWVELYQDGDKKGNIFESHIICERENDKCVDKTRGIIVLSVNDINNDEKLVKFYNPGSNASYPAYEINTNSLKSSF